MEPWHLAFRLHINKELENKNAERLGDRTLSVWASPRSDVIYAFATYTYTNLYGARNPNLFKSVQLLRILHNRISFSSHILKIRQKLQVLFNLRKEKRLSI